MIADSFSCVLFPGDSVKDEESTGVECDPFNYHHDSDFHKKFLWNHEIVENASSGDGTAGAVTTANAAAASATTATSDKWFNNETMGVDYEAKDLKEIVDKTISSNSFFMELHNSISSSQQNGTSSELDYSLNCLTRQVLSIFESTENDTSEAIKDEDVDVLKLLSFIMPELMDEHNNVSELPLYKCVPDDFYAMAQTFEAVKIEGHEETSSTAVKNELESLESWTTTTDTTSRSAPDQLNDDDKAWLAAAAIAAKIIPQKKKTIKMIKRVPRWVIVVKRNLIKPAKPSASNSGGDDDSDDDDEQDNSNNNDNDSFVSNLYSEADLDDDDCLPEATIQVLDDVFEGIGGIDDDGDEGGVVESNPQSSFNDSCVSFMSSLPPSGCWDHLKETGCE